MILCETHKFVFIKGVKVGGTSLEIALAAVCGDNDIITPITPVDERLRYELTGRIAQNFGMPTDRYRHYRNLISSDSQKGWIGALTPRGKYYNHMAYTEIVKLYGQIPSDFIVFAVSRSPYFKVISHANWTIQFGRYRAAEADGRSDAATVKKVVSALIASGKIRFCRDIDRYRDAEGKIATRIIRFERLSEEYSYLMRELGIRNPLPLPHAKKGLLSEEKDVREYLENDHIRTINEIYNDEFVEFGYPVLEV